MFLHENFNYVITDPDQFDADTALTFCFPGAYPRGTGLIWSNRFLFRT